MLEVPSNLTDEQLLRRFLANAASYIDELQERVKLLEARVAILEGP